MANHAPNNVRIVSQRAADLMLIDALHRDVCAMHERHIAERREAFATGVPTHAEIVAMCNRHTAERGYIVEQYAGPPGFPRRTAHILSHDMQQDYNISLLAQP